MTDRQIIDQSNDYYKKVELIRRPLLNYARSKIYGAQNAEDIVQNTILILCQKMNEFDANKSFHGWAFKICNFQIKRFITERLRNKEHCMENFEDLISGASDSCTDKIIQKEELKSKLKSVKYLKSKLPPQQLKVFNYIIRGVPRKKARKLMNLGETHFNLTYYRAIQSCKKILKNESAQAK